MPVTRHPNALFVQSLMGQLAVTNLHCTAKWTVHYCTALYSNVQYRTVHYSTDYIAHSSVQQCPTVMACR